MNLTRIGIDLGKSWFQVYGMDRYDRSFTAFRLTVGYFALRRSLFSSASGQRRMTPSCVAPPAKALGVETRCGGAFVLPPASARAQGSR